MRLAADLGMTLSELRHKMSAAEFVQWVAYYRVEAADREKAMKDAQRGRKRR